VTGQRDDPLTAIAGQVNAAAEAALSDTRLAEALDELAAAAQKARDLAAEHDAVVGELAEAALEAGAAVPGRHPVTVGPAWVSARHVIRKLRITEALYAVVAGDMARAREAARKVTNAHGGPVR
jgi:hypothetical protein